MYLVFFEVKWNKRSHLAVLKVSTVILYSSNPYVQKGFALLGQRRIIN